MNNKIIGREKEIKILQKCLSSSESQLIIVYGRRRVGKTFLVNNFFDYSFDFKVSGYFLYFTSHCVIEAMHVHASDRKLTEIGSAKFFVKGNGDTIVKARGILTDKDIRVIREFIKDNYKEMYLCWAKMSPNGFYGK